MEHITNVLVYSNRCEVLDSHVFTVGDKGFPHIRLKFIYMFGAETLQGKQLELKYILPDKSYQVENINVTEKDEVLFPIHYSVFVNGGWTTLKITIVEGANRITLDDIIIKTKKLEAEQEFQHKDVKAIVQTEITKISKKIKEFEEETKTELNTLKSNLSQNLETEKNSKIEALKEAYNNEIKKLDGDVKKVVTKYLKENTDKFNGEITALTNLVNNKENAFSKNTAFNKNFGTTADTVLEGNKLDEINEKFKTVINELKSLSIFSYESFSGNKNVSGKIYTSELNFFRIGNIVIVSGTLFAMPNYDYGISLPTIYRPKTEKAFYFTTNFNAAQLGTSTFYVTPNGRIITKYPYDFNQCSGTFVYSLD